MTAPLVSVEGLTVSFPGEDDEWVPVVQDVSFLVGRAQTVGLVGESGSGKTVTSLAMLGLTPYRGGRVDAGSVVFDGVDLATLGRREWQRVRGERIAMIFQQPVLSLNPSIKVGEQIAESIRMHLGVGRKAAWARAVEMLKRVEIADAERRAHEFPHMFSGGMCQRVMIAQALACEPDLLIADEPTTALDTTTQASILRLLADLQAETGISILLITHDLGVVAEMADSVVVMYGGEVVEVGNAVDVLTRSRHPYTEALLRAVPSMQSTSIVATPGAVPPPRDFVEGCRFAPRCPHVRDRCRNGNIELASLGGGHLSRCIRADELYVSDGHVGEAVSS